MKDSSNVFSHYNEFIKYVNPEDQLINMIPDLIHRINTLKQENLRLKQELQRK